MGIKIINIHMARESTENIPDFKLPEPYTLRPHREGDIDTWVNVQQKSEELVPISREVFLMNFGTSQRMLSERQLFLCNGKGTPVGTATAWFDYHHKGKKYGRVHWVAIVPEERGKKLAKPLMTAVCKRLKELGHDRIYLTTQPERIPAISLYLKFGFKPDILDDEEKKYWRQVKKSIKDLKF